MKIKRYTLFFISAIFFVSGILSIQAQETPERLFKNQFQYDPGKQAELKEEAAWNEFERKYGKWNVIFNERTGMPHRAYGEPVQLPGNTFFEKAEYFISAEANRFGVNDPDLKFRNERESKKYHYLDFVQKVGGVEVLGGEVSFRFTREGKLALFEFNYFPIEGLNTTPAFSESRAFNFAAAGITGEISGHDIRGLKILPVPTAEGYDYKLVYEIIIEESKPDRVPSTLHILVDAHSGIIHYRSSSEHTISLNLEANGNVHLLYPFKPVEKVTLPHMMVEYEGTTYYTGMDGKLDIPSVDKGKKVTLSLKGKYAKVNNASKAYNTATKTITIDTSQIVVDMDDVAEVDELSAYSSVNRVHDFMKEFLPDFTSMDNPLDVNVQISSATCNAFYSPTNHSINFFKPYSNCNTFAIVADVVFHEYGHGISHKFYNSKGTYFRNGALGEAFSDIWAMGIIDTPIIGLGTRKNNNFQVIRRYDSDLKVYPFDMVGEVHYDGEPLAGAFWHLAEFFGSTRPMMELFGEMLHSLPNGLHGQEGEIFHDILVDVLLADDDDGNLNNGTPNDLKIITAFAMHGIRLFNHNNFVHEEKPELSWKTNDTLTVNITSQQDYYMKKVRLKYKTTSDSFWIGLELPKNETGKYDFVLPAQKFPSVVNYYFELVDIFDSVSATYPKRMYNNGFPDKNAPFVSIVGYEFNQAEDFEFDTVFKDNNIDLIIDPFSEWTVGDKYDQANTGIWMAGIPMEAYADNFPKTNEYKTQPGKEDTRGRCVFTGNASYPFSPASTNDVDRGRTTLISPEYDLSGIKEPAFTYNRWYSSSLDLNPYTDYWEAYISGDGGNNWEIMEYTRIDDNSWRRVGFKISDFLDGDVTKVRFKFVVSDDFISTRYQYGQSVVEGAIDDIFFYSMKDTNEIQGPDSIPDTSIVYTQILLFPNPILPDGSFYLQLPKSISGEAELYNLSGRLISRFTVYPGMETYKIPDHEPAGLYLLKIMKDNGEFEVLKFVRPINP